MNLLFLYYFKLILYLTNNSSTVCFKLGLILRISLIMLLIFILFLSEIIASNAKSYFLHYFFISTL